VKPGLFEQGSRRSKQSRYRQAKEYAVALRENFHPGQNPKRGKTRQEKHRWQHCPRPPDEERDPADTKSREKECNSPGEIPSTRTDRAATAGMLHVTGQLRG
jgi:hypothetical protein